MNNNKRKIAQEFDNINTVIEHQIGGHIKPKESIKDKLINQRDINSGEKSINKNETVIEIILKHGSIYFENDETLSIELINNEAFLELKKLFITKIKELAYILTNYWKFFDSLKSFDKNSEWTLELF